MARLTSLFIVRRALTQFAKMVLGGIYVVCQVVVNIWRGEKQVHIIVVGPSRSGKTLLYNMVRASVSNQDDVFFPSSEGTAARTDWIFSKILVTERSLDLFSLRTVKRRYAFCRTIKVVVMIRDPRILVSLTKSIAANQYWHGYDYQLHMPGKVKRVKSFSDPGLVAIFERIGGLLANSQLSIRLFRYEDLVADVAKIQSQMESFFPLNFVHSFADFHKNLSCVDQQSAELGDLRSLSKNDTVAWSDEAQLKRIQQQLYHCPKLESIAQLYGYESADVLGLIPQCHGPGYVSVLVALFTQQAFEDNCCILRETLIDNDFSANTVFQPSLSTKPLIAETLTWILRYRVSLRGPILVVDGAAVIHKDPRSHFAMYDADLAIWVDRKGDFDYRVMLIGDSDQARDLLRLWIIKCGQSDVSAETALREIVESDELRKYTKFNVQRLPVNLCFRASSRPNHYYGEFVIEVCD